MDRRGCHDGWNTEDQDHQEPADERRLKKLHEAFQESCTLSKPSPVHLSSLSMAWRSPNRVVPAKEIRRHLGAVPEAYQ